MRGKHVLIGVTGGIAAYKVGYLIRELIKSGADVKVMMTEAGTRFVTPLTFSVLSKHPVFTDLWSARRSLATLVLQAAAFQDLVNATAKYPDVVLGILPAGGGNDLADALGLPHHPVRAAELLRDGDSCLMDVACVETADSQRIYTGGGGVGIDAESAHIAATRFRKLTGKFRYLLSAAFALIETGTVKVRVSFSKDGIPR